MGLAPRARNERGVGANESHTDLEPTYYERNFRDARLRPLITPRSEACTIDSEIPTPQKTCSPTSISR